MELIIAIIVFIGILFFSLSIHYLRKDKAARKKEDLVQRLTPAGPDDEAPYLRGEKKRTRLEQLVGGVINLAVLESLLISSAAPLSLERFFSLSLGTGLLFVLPMIVFFRNTFGAIVFAALGLFLPFIYLIHRRRKREQALVQQLPDMLDMIVRALRVGQSVNGALKEAATALPAPVGTEIRLVYEEIAMGLTFEHALRNFEKRFTNLTDVKIMCTAFIIQRETGGNLTRTLAGLSHTIRARFQLKRQVKAMTAEGRASAMILGLLPLFFAGVTYIFNPSYISVLFSHPMGRKLLLLAALFMAAGFTVMRIMTRIKV